MTSVNEATHNLVSSLFIICINAGQFLNPYWGSFLGNILGGALLSYLLFRSHLGAPAPQQSRT